MKPVRIILLIIVTVINTFIASGCWNYREVNQMAIVAGAAIDRDDQTGRYLLTVEMIDMKSDEKDTKFGSRVVSSEGETVFDAARNLITLVGKRLYWSHAKVVIISESLAKEGLIPVVDWLNRDAELRSDTQLLVSTEKTASEIFKGDTGPDGILSFNLDDMIRSQSSLSKFPVTPVWCFISELLQSGIAPVLPVVCLKAEADKKMPCILGTGIFKSDKLIGFLNGDETKYLLIIRNQMHAGLLVEYEKKNRTPRMALEIFSSNTSLKPDDLHGNIAMKVTVKTNVALAEVQGTEEFSTEKELKKLQNDADKSMQQNLLNLIRKVQNVFDSDVFGFGREFRIQKPGQWKSMEPHWEQSFKTLPVNVNCKVLIKNSALAAKTIRMGD